MAGSRTEISGTAGALAAGYCYYCFDRRNERQGALLVFHDLTRLTQLERVCEDFVGNVGHELRTPLSLIKGYAETLLGGAKVNPEVATKFLQTIDRNARRLDLLIQDLLTISTLESSRIALNPQPVSLLKLADRSLGDLKSHGGKVWVESEPGHGAKFCSLCLLNENCTGEKVGE